MLSVPHSPPLVSIALCVHNGGGYLREQMESLLAQSESRIEIVALDDASTDRSAAVLHEFAARDPRVRVFGNARNLGPQCSFERAMSLGRGDFIALSDQDDIWHPQKLEKLLAVIGDHDLAYCDSQYIDADGAPSGRRISDDLDMARGQVPLRLVCSNSVSGHAALLRRSLFEAARPFPDDVFHDWWLAIRAAAGNGLIYLDEPLVRFRRHDGAITGLGRRRGRPLPDRHRAWLEQRRSILAALHRRLRDDADQARWLGALDDALSGGSPWPLFRELWREREAAPPGSRPAMLDALRLHLRFVRKLRRARAARPRAARDAVR